MPDEPHRPHNMGPEVSVVIATYRRPQLLARAITSVLAQTMNDLEVIVVDDEPSDKTQAVAASFSEERVRYLRHEHNRGLPAARNTGIRAARGRYIAFLDDDDQWISTKLERQLKLIEGHDAVLTAAYSIDGRVEKKFSGQRVTEDDLRRGNFFDPSSLLVRADLIRSLMFDESLRVGEDWDAFIRIAQRGRIAYIEEPLIVYDDSPAKNRMTMESVAMPIAEIEKRMSILYKHEPFLGNFWMRYHVARFVLSHMRRRKDGLTHVVYALKRCGIGPVIRVALDKSWRLTRARITRICANSREVVKSR